MGSPLKISREELESLASSPGLRTYAEPTQEDLRESLRKSLGISSWDNTFANFQKVPGTSEAVKLFKELAGGPSWFMLFCYGGVGSGKSHLCEALSIELNRKGIFCPIYRFSEMMGYFKRCFSGDFKSEFDSVLTSYKRAKRLIIDDVGIGGDVTVWEWKTLSELIDYRYSENLLTVITANLDPTELPDRVLSRLRDVVKSRIVLNSAGDYRLKKEK